MASIAFITVQIIEVAPWGADSIAHPRYPNEDDSALGIHLHHPHLSRHRHPSLAHLGNLPLCRGRYLHRPQHHLGYPLSHLRDKIEEEEGFRKSGGVSAVGVCLVLHRLGIELFTAEYLL